MNETVPQARRGGSYLYCPSEEQDPVFGWRGCLFRIRNKPGAVRRYRRHYRRHHQ